jgi:hypothetical protein
MTPGTVNNNGAICITNHTALTEGVASGSIKNCLRPVSETSEPNITRIINNQPFNWTLLLFLTPVQLTVDRQLLLRRPLL